MSNLLATLRLLAEPTRLRLFLLLNEEELSVAELQDILGMGQSRISSNLAQLKRVSLVVDRRVGKNIYYVAREENAAALVSLLDAGRAELPETKTDLAALQLALKKRKDTASDYFNRLAGKFGRTYIPGRSWQALAHALLRLLPPQIIADLGAGEGMLSQLLARSAKQVIAVDSSPAMVEFGGNLARENGFTNLEYRLGDIEAPPIEDASVDIALFSQALHHAGSPARAVGEAHRILRPGGRVVILDLASHSHEAARELYGHVWLGFSEVELYQLLQKAGFQNVEISLVAREKQTPHFQTLLATALK